MNLLIESSRTHTDNLNSTCITIGWNTMLHCMYCICFSSQEIRLLIKRYLSHSFNRVLRSHLLKKKIKPRLFMTLVTFTEWFFDFQILEKILSSIYCIWIINEVKKEKKQYFTHMSHRNCYDIFFININLPQVFKQQ